MKIHFLKLHPQYFEDVANGRKKAEFRFNDRDYKVGDFITFEEYGVNGYTSRTLHAVITHVLSDFYSLPTNWVVLSIELLKKEGSVCSK